MKYRENKGFTLVELLVVIAIIGILIALLPPTVQAEREGRKISEITDGSVHFIVEMVEQRTLEAMATRGRNK